MERQNGQETVVVGCVSEGPQITLCGPPYLGNPLRNLLHAELIKGLGEGLGDLGGVPIFDLVPL
jgi:hypothetical protein